ncbi:MAG: hypothetical protein M1823_001524 [Watsoniomyces obsoletus]|nr:MAG: hypothetical protein M1823_001524 [Watsoniomyces obsoletus]
MPAPLAKGILIGASIIVTVGVAVYESPEIQQWLEQMRQKILIAFQGDPAPPRPMPSKEEQEAAVAAARRKREEVMVRNRHLFVRQRSQQMQQAVMKKDFDDFLKGDGSGSYTLHNTSAEPQANTGELRRRPEEGQVLFDLQTAENNVEAVPDQSTPDASPVTLDHAVSEDHSQPLVKIESTPHSRASSVVIATPASSATEGHPEDWPQAHSELSEPYFSINEWAESASPSFYHSPNVASQVEHPAPQQGPPPQPPSLPDDYMSAHADDTESRFSDVISDTTGMHTPGTWTEVGSEVSEGDLGSQ